jgi:hypothetical protein
LWKGIAARQLPAVVMVNTLLHFPEAFFCEITR